MRRLTMSGIKPFRLTKNTEQGGVCPLCEEPLPHDETVLDHDHKSGECRGVIHRGCNALLGKIENNLAMNDMKDPEKLKRFLKNLEIYIATARLGVLYPTHKTEEEKRIKRNKKARKRRAIKKEMNSANDTCAD